MNNIAKILEEEIISLNNLIFLLDEAARTERFLSKPKHPGTPSMYDAILTTYEKKDIGYYDKALSKLRATPRQIIWMRANRFKWTQVGRHFGFNRTSIKNRYMKVLSAVANKIKKNNKKYCKLNKILYLI